MSISVIYDYCSTKAANITINRSAGITHTHTCAASSDRQPKAYIKSRQLNNRHHTTRTYPPRSHTHCMRCSNVLAYMRTAELRTPPLYESRDFLAPSIWYFTWNEFALSSSRVSRRCVFVVSIAGFRDRFFSYWNVWALANLEMRRSVALTIADLVYCIIIIIAPFASARNYWAWGTLP